MVSGPYDIALGKPARGPAWLRVLDVRALAPAVAEQADRWPLWLPVCLAAGIGGYIALPIEPPDAVFAIALCTAAALGLGARRGWARPLSLFLSALLFGFVLAKARSEAVRAPVLPATSGLVTVSGAIEEIAQARRSMLRFLIKVDRIEGLRNEAWPSLAQVTARRPTDRLRLGDHVELRTRLLPPARPVEPGAYDPALRLWFEGIGATGFSLEAPKPDSSRAGSGGGLRGLIEDTREAIGARIASALPPLQASIATALVTGERGSIPETVNEDLRASGLYHILSISGLHLMLVAGSVFWIVRALLALSPALALRRPIKKWAAGAWLAVATAYLMISGAEVATQRATLMLAIMCLAVMLDRPALSIRNVALAALAILALTPEAVVSASFQMSFLAVVGLIAFFEVYSDWRRRKPAREVDRSAWRRLLRFVLAAIAMTAVTTLIASLFTSLPGVYHFNRMSNYAVLANVLALPVVSILIMPAALISVVAMPLGLETLPLHIVSLGIDSTLAIARWVAELPGSTHGVRSIPVLATLLLGLGALWLCLWRGRLRLWGLSFVGLGLILAPWEPRPDILVENAGRNVAVRNQAGDLAPALGRRTRYAVERWLLKDGDTATPADAARRKGWTCAEGLCQAEIRGKRVAYATKKAREDLPCPDADILISEFPLRGRCADVTVRIDRFDVWRNGAYALFISEAGDIKVSTAASLRGARPWAAPPVARRDILEPQDRDRGARTDQE